MAGISCCKITLAHFKKLCQLKSRIFSKINRVMETPFVIYAIRHIESGHAYFGVTRHQAYRFYCHEQALKKNKHHNVHLQRAWNAHGGAAFRFEIIERIESERVALKRELHWIRTKEAVFNIRGKIPEPIDIPPLKRGADIESQARLNLLRLAQLYCNTTGYKISTVGRRAHSDGKFFDTLLTQQRKEQRTDSKGSFTFRIYDRVLNWFMQNWPGEIEFPILDDLVHNIERATDGKSEETDHEGRPPGSPDERGEGGESGESGSNQAGGRATQALHRLRGRG